MNALALLCAFLLLLAAGRLAEAMLAAGHGLAALACGGLVLGAALYRVAVRWAVGR
jgi:hypothetical protein